MIIDGVDPIHRLQTYENSERLKPTTLLRTFDITNLYTMLPQDESITILNEFVVDFGYHEVKNIPLDAIRKITRIVLLENVFSCDSRYYRQIVGGALRSPFTLTFANIFMWKWEQTLVQQ